MNSKNIKTKTINNLIGENKFQQFLEIQASYGYAQRGGAILKKPNCTSIEAIS